VKPKIYYFSNH